MTMRPLINDALRAFEPYVPGKPVKETERELGITGCVKLASNENPYGPSPRALAVLKGELGDLHLYPDSGAYYLKEALARRHGVSASRIVVGNGTNEIIELIARTCLLPDDNVVCAVPSFIVYKLVTLAMGRVLREVPVLPDLRYDVAAMARACDEKTKILFLGNPDNPTGTYLPRPVLEALLREIPPSVLVVVDEAYFEYAHAPDYPNALDYLDLRERLVVLRTFSKCYGLAGLRVGYGIGAPELIDYMNRARQAFNANTLAQAAALAALDDEAHVRHAVDMNRAELPRLIAELRSRDIVAHDSQGNFVLADFGRNGEDVFQALLRRGVIVRPMRPYGLPNALRITVGRPDENDRLLGALDSLFAEPRLDRRAPGPKDSMLGSP
jgi:histidinol-phosphate aminotransferase